jgi:hypothetical protein
LIPLLFLGRLDLEYQNSSTKVAAHWHGFIDTESGIQNYNWCVGTTNDVAECSVMDWIDVGLHVSASRKLSSAITQGNIINILPLVEGIMVDYHAMEKISPEKKSTACVLLY